MRSGFTLIELVIVIAIGVVILSVVGCEDDHAAALSSAKEVASNYDDVKSVTCVNKDSDNDGYCSCTIYRESGPESLECGCQKWGLNKTRGCKAAQYKIRGKTKHTHTHYGD